MFVGLQRDADEAERYARQLTQQVVFSGPEMSTAAMSVARAIIAGQWPSEREWADLAAQYETDLLMAGAQRPGLMGVEEPPAAGVLPACFSQSAADWKRCCAGRTVILLTWCTPRSLQVRAPQLWSERDG